MLPDDAFLLLHEVRLRGVVVLHGGPDLELLLGHGLVARARTSVRITPAGRELHAGWARAGRAAEEVAERAYERFVPLNTELLRVCNDWQVRPGNVPNDHRDQRYDWGVLDRLRSLDERTAPVVRRLARTMPRFGTYPASLRVALAHLDDGALEWLTSPRIDSYHTVWMRLHEDLLLALGRDRADEPS